MKYFNFIIKLSFLALLIDWTLLPSKVEMQNIIADNSNTVKKLYFEKGVFKIAYAPNGKIFAVGDERGIVRLFDTKTWKVLYELKHSDVAYQPMFSPDSKILVTQTGELAKGGLRNEKIWFWNVETGKNIFIQEEGNVKYPISAMTFSPNGKMMAWGNSDGRIRLVNIEEIKNIKTVNDQLGRVKWREISAIKFSPDGQLLAVGSFNSPAVTLIDINMGKEVFSFNFVDTNILFVYNLTFSSDGKILAISAKFGEKNNREYTLRLFKTDTWEMMADLRNHDGTIGLDFTPNGELLVAVSEDEVDIVDVTAKKTLKTIKYEGISLGTSALSPDGKSIAIGGIDDRVIRIYPTQTKESRLLEE